MNGSPVLTDKSQFILKMPQPCAMANNSPCPGGPVIVHNSANTVRIHGQGVLTDSSYLTCSFEQKLNPTKSSKIASGAEKPVFGNESANTDIGGEQSSGRFSNQSSGEVDNSAANGNDGRTQTPADKSVKQASENALSDIEESMCKSCEYDDNCPYKNASGDSGNDSITLRSNYEETHNYEYYRAEDIISNANTRSAAHHMISGNQSFAKCMRLLRLLNSISGGAKLYDVNNSENCILLPTSWSGFGEMEMSVKRETSYDIMSQTGMQFHSGSHKYEIPLDILPKGEDYKIYADVVREKLERLESCIDSVDGCPYKDEDLKCNIVAGMYNLQDEIRERLNSFKDDPSASSPYFVSRISMEYAFAIPATVNVAVFIKYENEIRAVFLRYNNDVKRGRKYVIEKEKKTFPLDMAECKRQVVEFCKNAMYIILSDEDVALPFANCYKKIMRITDPIDASFNGMIKELALFIDENQVSYNASQKIIMRRLNE